jgi:hypothetical protein
MSVQLENILVGRACAKMRNPEASVNACLVIVIHHMTVVSTYLSQFLRRILRLIDTIYIDPEIMLV